MIHNEITVDVISCTGTDSRAVQSARISLCSDNSENPDHELNEKDKNLLNFLIKEGHTSPFEHSIITFKIKCPLFVRNQIMRHRTFSYNEISRRYTSKDIEFFVPRRLKKQATKNLQCSDGFIDKNTSTFLIADISEHLENSWALYLKMLDAGVSKEEARSVFPQSLFTEFWMTGNLLNYIKFLNLRDSSHAQEETQQVAKQIKIHLRERFPLTMKASFESSDLQKKGPRNPFLK